MVFDSGTIQALIEPRDIWPDEAEKMYERVTAIGRGSYGLVWVGRRKVPPMDKNDDEYAALKSIKMKDASSQIYAEREIAILSEVRHPNVIHLIRAFPLHNNGNTRVVVMRLARGPNLQSLIVTGGALGLPLAQLVSRQLIAALSYLHGRAVIHRDIKPANIILENLKISPRNDYAWESDKAIWSDGPDAKASVKEERWRIVLVDFGFARALTNAEIHSEKNNLRNSIINESSTNTYISHSTPSNRNGLSISDAARLVREADDVDDDDDDDDPGQGSNDSSGVRTGAAAISEKFPEEFVEGENIYTGEEAAGRRRRKSYVSQPVPPIVVTRGTISASSTLQIESGSYTSREAECEHSPTPRKRTSILNRGRRTSIAHAKVRAMSALGTKAYAAPEIKNDLREKVDEDLLIDNMALTSCVADYGMIVDAYSAGWTLRVVITGVPPTISIADFLTQNVFETTSARCCGKEKANIKQTNMIRVPMDIPESCRQLIRKLTRSRPEDRITIREAQSEPWITGEDGDSSYLFPEGDYPSKHGDPVVPLKCAEYLTEQNRNNINTNATRTLL